jgi:hypothetical protein
VFRLALLSINHNLKSNMLSHYEKERQGKGRRLRKGLTAGVTNLKERARQRKVSTFGRSPSASRPTMGERDRDRTRFLRHSSIRYDW